MIVDGFDIDAWYRRYHRYPQGSTVRAGHELNDLVLAYRTHVQEQLPEDRFQRMYLGDWKMEEAQQAILAAPACTCPDIAQMRTDLFNGGWTPSFNSTVWTNLQGQSYRGPHKAWHIWHGGTEEWQRIEQGRK